MISDHKKHPFAGFWITVALVAVLAEYPPHIGSYTSLLFSDCCVAVAAIGIVEGPCKPCHGLIVTSTRNKSFSRPARICSDVGSSNSSFGSPKKAV